MPTGDHDSARRNARLVGARESRKARQRGLLLAASAAAFAAAAVWMLVWWGGSAGSHGAWIAGAKTALAQDGPRVHRECAGGRRGAESGSTEGGPGWGAEFERAARLRVEALAAPSVPLYVKHLASCLSQILQAPIAALARAALTADGPLATSVFVDVDSSMRASVLRGLWEVLSEELSGRGHAAPWDGGHLTIEEARHLEWWARFPGVSDVCEVGFNAGHSAAAMLLAAPNVTLLSMDLGEHAHVLPAARVISSLFPQRFRIELGPSEAVFAALVAKGMR